VAIPVVLPLGRSRNPGAVADPGGAIADDDDRLTADERMDRRAVLDDR
jgi:hypothetical protein